MPLLLIPNQGSWSPYDTLNLLWSKKRTTDQQYNPFVLTPDETCPMLSLVLYWLDTRNASFVSRISLCAHKFSPHILEWASFYNPLKFVVIPVVCSPFFTCFPSTRLSINVPGSRTLRRASFVRNDPSCLTLLWQGVSELELSSQQSSPWLRNRLNKTNVANLSGTPRVSNIEVFPQYPHFQRHQMLGFRYL